jgi:hypothetical protein
MASTDIDQKALPLLVNEFNNMAALTDRYLKITVSKDYLAARLPEQRPSGAETIDVLAVAGVVESVCG